MKNYLRSYLKSWVVLFGIVFLPVFSFGIFAPTEVFFANYSIFGVVFGEFGWKFLLGGLAISLVISAIAAILPKVIKNVVAVGIWMFSICGYIQTMFLNGHIDQIGATNEGYQPSQQTIIINLLIWLAIIAVLAGVLLSQRKRMLSVIVISSWALIGVQLIAYISLFLGADEKAFSYEESELVLDGTTQYEVSPNDNIIVLVLDNISNVAYAYSRLEYPEMNEVLKDFTYYNNADSNYYGTFPSLCHIMTGYEYDPSIKINDWTADAWNNERTSSFYQQMHAQNYDVHVYINPEEPELLVGQNGIQLLEDSVDNVRESSSIREIDYPKLYKTLLQMACYRFLPEICKPAFDVPNSQYANLVTYPDNVMNSVNPLYYADLKEKGLVCADTNRNYLIFQYLNGIHELINDENCELTLVEDYRQTMAGIWRLLDEYLNQLKACGVYDDATIIVTSDHGTEFYGQNIFFIKPKGQTSDVMAETNAAITLQELLPTIAECADLDVGTMGNTIWDYHDNEARTRTIYMRNQAPEYPDVPRFDGVTRSSYNTYRAYTYTGNLDCYWDQYYAESYKLIPTLESYY